MEGKGFFWEDFVGERDVDAGSAMIVRDPRTRGRSWPVLEIVQAGLGGGV
jgi:hypothetical protein